MRSQAPPGEIGPGMPAVPGPVGAARSLGRRLAELLGARPSAWAHETGARVLLDALDAPAPPLEHEPALAADDVVSERLHALLEIGRRLTETLDRREIFRLIVDDTNRVLRADGTVIRLNIPTLTAERRKDLVKLAKNMAEDSRVAVRNVRRDIIQDLKDLKKEGEISEDDERRAEEEVQKLTDSFIERINEVLHHKEEEILEI